MIITLTGNLLAERTLEFSAWQPGKTQRAIRETFQVGGKGINVSKMLTHLGARTTALCFVGGTSGEECAQWLRAHAIEHHAIRTSGNTRAGTVVRAAGQPETTFLGPDAPPDAHAFAACAAWLDAQPVTCTLAICGSIPGWDTPAAKPLRDAIARRIAHGNVYIDTYGPPLATLIAEPVALVKINRTEFDQLCAGIPNHDPLATGNPMPIRLTAACKRWPARAWVITDGPGPVWHVTRDAKNLTAAAEPASLQPPTIREVSATGSGDVLFAGILHTLKNQNATLTNAVAIAIPYAAANASSSGIAEINKN